MLDRFSAEPYFQTSEIVTQIGVSYGVAEDYLGNNYLLQFDISYPNAAFDTLSHLPVVIMMHGGGFLVGDKVTYTTFYIRELAKRGYMALSINYRLGWNTNGAINQCLGDTLSFLHAAYRATQDAHAAARYIASPSNWGSFRNADTNNFFFGGGSAGGMMAMNLAYIDQAEFSNHASHYSDNLGALDTSGNNFTTSFTIKGIVSSWASFLDTTFIDEDDEVPALLFHGRLDTVMPFISDNILMCDTPNAYPIFYGSLPVASRLRNSGFCYDFSTDKFGNHGGSGFYSLDYRMRRTSCFFGSIMCNDCGSHLLTDTLLPDTQCFYSITSGSTEGSLPIKLISFTARSDDGRSALLEWITAEEENLRMFEILRGTDPSNMEVIGSVNSKGSSSPVFVHYDFHDPNPPKGDVYYQLRMVYYDEPEEFSNLSVVSIHQQQILVKIIPNPFFEHISIDYVNPNADAGTPQVYIHDMTGKSLDVPIKYHINNCIIDTRNLPVGAYFVRVQFDNIKVFSQKLLKQ